VEVYALGETARLEGKPEACSVTNWLHDVGTAIGSYRNHAFNPDDRE
jgi:hypothetical protein